MFLINLQLIRTFHGLLPLYRLLSIGPAHTVSSQCLIYYSQLIRTFHDIFAEAQLPLWLRPFEVGQSAGQGAIPCRALYCLGQVGKAPQLEAVAAALWLPTVQWGLSLLPSRQSFVGQSRRLCCFALHQHG